MSPTRPGTPDVLPLLSRGRHRNPRKGACFMELASYLAGERWSDHPSCTHPLLAALARHVNDRTGDAERPHLAPLIPEVIGLTGDDPLVDVRIAVNCAAAALPIASEECQRVMAVALLSCDTVLLELPGPQAQRMAVEARRALAAAPAAERWARQFLDRVGGAARVRLREFRRNAAPNTVACAVEGIASACVGDSDARLRALLARTITDCAEVLRPAGSAEAAVDAARWAAACRLPGVSR